MRNTNKAMLKLKHKLKMGLDNLHTKNKLVFPEFISIR